MTIVAEQYALVIGVDTHAATHSFALISATNGGTIAQAVFPNSPSGLDRACAWIARGIDEKGMSGDSAVHGILAFLWP